MTLQDLLGDIPYPTIPADIDFRDAGDLVNGAIREAYEKDPNRFFGVLENDPKLLESGNVVWALGSVDDARAIPHLISVLAHGDSMLRWSAAHGLEKRRDPRVIDAFIAAISDRAPTVRAVVIEALGKMKAKRAVATLQTALTKKSNANDKYLRSLIEAALKKLGA